jgi:ribonuclease HI
MFISADMKSQLKWWIENLHCQKRHIIHPDKICDASLYGWGSVCSDISIGSRWTEDEAKNHINYLELLAVFLALKSFCKFLTHKHVQIKSDNSCAVSFINNMGGCQSLKCDSIANAIWQWSIKKNIWLSATHIPGKHNIADYSSLVFKENIEWKLNENIFEIISTFIW